MEITGLEDFAARISKYADKSSAAIKVGMYQGAGQLLAAVRAEVENLPTEPNRILKDGEQFNVFTETNKRDLLEGLYVHTFVENGGRIETWVSFDGYGSIPTKKYPQGVPNALIANAINSGSSVRKKNRFMARAKKAGEAPAREAIEEGFLNFLEKEGNS